MNYETLLNCIEVLEKVRNTHYSQLDTSVLAELDGVIDELKKHKDSRQGNIELGNLSLRALQVISQTVNLVCSIANLMK